MTRTGLISWDILAFAGRVFLHPGSVLFAENKLKNGYLTYFNKSVTSKPFLRDATEVSFCCYLRLHPSEST